MKTLSFYVALMLFTCFACTQQKQQEDTMPQSNEWLTFRGKSNSKKIVLISGDEEYRSEEALPQLAKILSNHHGFECTVLFAQKPEQPGVIQPNFQHNIPGLEALENADLAIIFTRFRALPDEQMKHIEQYLLAGKPIIGIRTATHAFHFKDTTSNYAHWGNYYEKEGDTWRGGFGRLVLGERWHTHHGHHKHQSTRGIIVEEATQHPILRGIANGDIWGATDVYGVRLPMLLEVQPLILGQVVDRTGDFDENDRFFGLRPTDNKIATINPASKEPYHPNDPMMPIVWLKPYQLPNGKSGMAFTSTIGASTDLLSEGVRRLFVNATYHLLGMPVPEKAKVDLVGDYQPSAYNFHKDEYWENKQLKVIDLK